jgi:beta-lactamase regulating signal transducer with metallopeptidase domain
MNFLAQLLSPVVMRLLALTLLHFLWQGTALVVIAYVGMMMCRTAQTRYAVGLAMVVLMGVAPAMTYFTLHSVEQTGAISSPSMNIEVNHAATHTIVTAKATTASHSPNVLNYCFWMVQLWFAGVVIFSVRSAGGVLLVERLRRRESKQVSERLLALCLNLQRKLGLQRLVLFCECTRLDAPAVAGWLRPTILLPISALTGLSEEQLSSIVAHELAHIKRYDSFVNLFQVVVETFLFYHPAVWWLNKRIREERENCCDDIAVSVCGNPLAYAHALARLAGARTSPRLLMAVNSHPLAARVARLLGISNHSGMIRRADLSLGLLCISASLVAGGAFLGAARTAHAQQQSQNAISATVEPSPTSASAPSKSVPPISVTAATAPAAPAPMPAAKPIPYPMPPIAPVPAPQVTTPGAAPALAQTPSSSYIDGLKSAGLDNLTVDELIALKITGVTPEYAKEIHQLGLKADADELIGMKIQDVTPEYVRTMRAATGQQLTTDDLIAMKIQGVTPEYLKQIHDLGMKPNADQVVGLKTMGITPEYIQEMRKLDLKIETENVIALKVQGVTPEYVQSIRALGLHPDAEEFAAMKIQGIDADYIKKMQAAGFKLDADDAISAKVMGITPEFIEKVRSHGFKDLSLHQLIGLKESGVLDSAEE